MRSWVLPLALVLLLGVCLAAAKASSSKKIAEEEAKSLEVEYKDGYRFGGAAARNRKLSKEERTKSQYDDMRKWFMGTRNKHTLEKKPQDDVINKATRAVGDLTGLTAAVADECFNGVTSFETGAPNCTATGLTPKWTEGQTSTIAIHEGNNTVWFGTATNPFCPDEPLYWGFYQLDTVLLLAGVMGGPFYESIVSSALENVAGLGLALPEGVDCSDTDKEPVIYAFDHTIGTVARYTSGDTGFEALADMKSVAAAGAFGDYIYLAGPSQAGVIFMVIHAPSHTVAATFSVSSLRTCRRFIEAPGGLYAACVYNEDGTGAILRFNASGSTTFATVGRIPTAPFDMTVHDDRIFVTTWPNDKATFFGLRRSELSVEERSILDEVGVWMSPDLLAEDANLGLEDSDNFKWNQVWRVSDYEPDRVVAISYHMGAIASFDGWLYFGTINPPALPFVAHRLRYGFSEVLGNELLERLLVMLGTLRGSIIVRGRTFGDPILLPEYQLVSGSPFLTVYNPAVGWLLRENNMGLTQGGFPRSGLNGLDNYWNSHIWSMATLNSSLLIGTLDWSAIYLNYLEAGIDADIADALPFLLPVQDLNGADLFRFLAGVEVPEEVDSGGNNNPYTCGWNSMVVQGNEVFMSGFNPFNVPGAASNSPPPTGGWSISSVYY